MAHKYTIAYLSSSKVIITLQKGKSKVLQKIEHIFSGSDSLKRQGYLLHPRDEYLPRQALSLGWVPVRSPVLSGLNLSLITIIGIAGSKLTIL
jgi:hypothetical protein